MRVIAGTLRGRRLAAPPHLATRPTPDRVREALFSALESARGGPGSLAGARVLDLFAGTGALGIEALSRGAASAVFVERDPAALAALRENLERLGLAERSRVAAEEAEHYLGRRGEEAPFDLVFLDPPFSSGRLERVLERLEGWPGLAPRGTLIAEHPAGETPGGAAWRVRFRRDYGSVGLTLLASAAEAAKEGR
jgi:16S rRNA (guanine966-N2)-methyltransferase